MDPFSYHRVVVKAQGASPRLFRWEIVLGRDPGTVAQSDRAFKTMEEAYTDGAAALKRLKGKLGYRD
jgi:hypothetical protein